MAILTLSREFGSGGEEIGRVVSKALGYGVVDRKTILEDMKAAGPQWERFGEEFDEHYPNLWERYDWSFRGYVAFTQHIILQYAVKDKVVLIGRGGNFLLKGIPHAFRVRVTLPREERIKRIITRDDVNLDIAEWLIDKADSEMSRSVHLIYGKNWDDPAEYDAIFDLGVLKQEEVVNRIVTALQEKEKLNTEEARKTLQMRAVAAMVKAGIATNPKFLIPTLEVEPQENSIVVRGVIHSADEHRTVEAEARRLAGSVPVTCSLHYR